MSGLFAHKAKQTKVTYVWALNGGSSTANVGGNTPTFEVNYAGLPGVNPAPGHAKLTPAAAMGPGEYAVALRPVDKSHKFSGEEVAKNQAEGLLFNYAWAFSVR